MVTFTYIIFGLLMGITIYFTHLFVIYTISDIYNQRKKLIPKQLYIKLAKILGIYLFIFLFFWYSSSFLYSIIYIIGFSYLGFFINVLMGCGIYKLIKKYKNISLNFSKIIIFIIPFIITIYSLINAQIMVFQEETLIYPQYNNTIKILHLTDMHLGAIYQKGTVENIIKIIEDKKPDVVVITGDLSDGSLKVESEWLEPFNKIPDSIPILYITGNHENLYGKKEIINEVNKIRKIKHIGNTVLNIKGVLFIGVDYEYKDIKTRAKLLLDSIELKDNKIPTVLLYHIPKITPKDLNKIGIFLMLSGHTHGGQIFPFTILSWLYNTCFSGLYNYNNSNYVYVSTGIGTALTPMRIFSSKMVALITIKGFK